MDLDKNLNCINGPSFKLSLVYILKHQNVLRSTNLKNLAQTQFVTKTLHKYKIISLMLMWIDQTKQCYDAGVGFQT